MNKHDFNRVITSHVKRFQTTLEQKASTGNDLISQC